MPELASVQTGHDLAEMHAASTTMFISIVKLTQVLENERPNKVKMLLIQITIDIVNSSSFFRLRKSIPL